MFRAIEVGYLRISFAHHKETDLCILSRFRATLCANLFDFRRISALYVASKQSFPVKTLSLREILRGMKREKRNWNANHSAISAYRANGIKQRKTAL